MSGLISGFGSALTYVVLPIQMYKLTHSTVMVGLLSMAATLALLTLNATFSLPLFRNYRAPEFEPDSQTR